MKTLFKYSFAYIVLCSLIGVLAFLSLDAGWFHQPIADTTEPSTFSKAVERELDKEFIGNFAMALFEEGKVKTKVFSSAGTSVDETTLFQVASLSKFVSAIGVMKLYEDGLLDLDRPVMDYLTRWELPPSAFDNTGVTPRRLLSHTAGLTDGLGYSGFLNPNDVQSLESSLTKAADADDQDNGMTQVGIEPGTEWKYSGGGFTLLQLLIEEVSGQSFDIYMKEQVLIPLGMTNSTYLISENESKLCEFYHEDGSLAPHFYYTSLAATSLYTTLEDLVKFTQLFLTRSDDHQVLSKSSLVEMRMPHGIVFGEPIYGLGTMLFAEISDGEYIFGHDGSSTPPINTAFRLDPQSGGGIIILETGSPLLATRIASDWVFIKSGKVDPLLFTMLQGNTSELFLLACGLILLFLVGHRIWIIRTK